MRCCDGRIICDVRGRSVGDLLHDMPDDQLVMISAGSAYYYSGTVADYWQDIETINDHFRAINERSVQYATDEISKAKNLLKVTEELRCKSRRYSVTVYPVINMLRNEIVPELVKRGKKRIEQMLQHRIDAQKRRDGYTPLQTRKVVRELRNLLDDGYLHILTGGEESGDVWLPSEYPAVIAAYREGEKLDDAFEDQLLASTESESEDGERASLHAEKDG